MTEVDAAFSAAVAQYELSLSPEQSVQIVAYCHLLWDWNSKLNLTRHTDFDKFVGRDLVDTLQLAAHLQPNEEVLDLGSGGGVPGIPLAILRPDLQVSLSESVGKRAKVLDSIVQSLNLPITVYEARGEDVLEDFRFDSVVTRAVGSLVKLCQWMKPHWHSIGRVLAIKGPKWIEERGEARHLGLMGNLDLRKLAEYPMAGADGMGVILQLSRKKGGAEHG
jgi:16S rRNA (guanine527-N7)-methyltransferase